MKRLELYMKIHELEESTSTHVIVYPGWTYSSSPQYEYEIFNKNGSVTSGDGETEIQVLDEVYNKLIKLKK